MKSSVTGRISIGFFLLAALFFGCVGQQDSQLQSSVTTQTNGKLYISNLGDSSLLIYDNALAANGNHGPTRRIPDLVGGPLGIVVDTISNRLYAANAGRNEILIYNNASTINGNSVPDRVISGPATTLNSPRGLALDTTKDILYVSNTGSNNILVLMTQVPLMAIWPLPRRLPWTDPGASLWIPPMTVFMQQARDRILF
jgi:DNA-binding beta-propeller fold protein YncE